MLQLLPGDSDRTMLTDSLVARGVSLYSQTRRLVDAAHVCMPTSRKEVGCVSATHSSLIGCYESDVHSIPTNDRLYSKKWGGVPFNC